MAPSSDDSSSSSSSQSSPSNDSKDSSSNNSPPSGGDSSSSSNNGGNGNSGSSNNGGNDSSGGNNNNNSGGNNSGGNNSNNNNSGGNNSGGNDNSGGGDNGDKDSGGNNSSGGNSNSGQNSNNSGQNNNNSGQNNNNNNSGQNNNNNGNQNNNNNSGQNNSNSGQNNNNNNNNQGNQNQNQNHNNNNNWNAPPPPPPPPPPPHGRKSPPKAVDSNDSPTPSSKSNSTPVIVGCVAGAGLLLFVLIALFLACTKRKKKRTSTHLMDNPGRPNGTGSDYWQSGPYKPNGHEHILNMPPPPALASSGWNGRGNQPPMVSSEMNSSNFSGPAGPPLPPPHPSVALGFNTSTFSYDDLAAATSGFSHAKLLGQGGFGFVHKGVLPNGKEIAVKSLKSGSGQGDREFAAEVEIISRVHHRHLVSLVGYCLAGDRKLLVYEFVPNNNLEFHLYSKNRPPLDWASRVKIALGSAKGLAYLHEDCHPKIIHRDIKAANILIDHNFEAKVADFGLAKLNQENVTHVSTRVMGTFGYLAPEYASSGKLTEKSDVFSFGIMLLELITGRRPVDTTGEYEEDTLVDWARPLCVKAMEDRNYNELVDPRLENKYNHEEMARMVACASTSVRQSAKKRPKMSQIVRVLEGDVSLEDLHDGIKPSPSSLFGGSATSSEFDTDSYNSNMKNFRKTSPLSGESQDFPSSEYGVSNSDEIVKKV